MSEPLPRLRAEEWAELLLAPDPTPVAAGIVTGDPLAWPSYTGTKAAASGDEAVGVWRGRLGETETVLIAFDFAHIGGSMSAGAGARVARAFETATIRGVPVVTVAATGGSRMQEGMVALAQMGRVSVAVATHAGAGLPHLAVASDPTTGGVYASLVAGADLLVSEPGAYVGFAGPRVADSLGGVDVGDANRAEDALRHGLVDAVVPREELRSWLARALSVLGGDTGRVTSTPSEGAQVTRPGGAPASAWATVEAARAADRPRARDYIAALDDVTRLSGDRAGGVDDGVLAVLGRASGRPVAVVGLDRTAVSPAGYRTAWRLLGIAERMGLPLVTLLDTPGADPAPAAEAAGQAAAISGTLQRLVGLRVPTVAVVVGEGGSGGAFALGVADRLLVQEQAIFSVIAPEGAAAILHRDPARAPEVAEQLRLTAVDLVDLGIAHARVEEGVAATWTVVGTQLDELAALSEAERLAARADHWGELGERFTRTLSP